MGLNFEPWSNGIPDGGANSFRGSQSQGLLGDWGALVAHERVHVLQQDFVLSAWSQPLAERALHYLPGGRAVSRFVAVDAVAWVVGTAMGIFAGSLNQDAFPTELEAHFLAGR